MITGMPSIINVDENNICNIMMENCAPYDVTLERDYMLGIMETKEEELVPLTDDFVVNAAFLYFETSKLWVLNCIFVDRWKAEGLR
jgi:hypothetical protein